MSLISVSVTDLVNANKLGRNNNPFICKRVERFSWRTKFAYIYRIISLQYFPVTTKTFHISWARLFLWTPSSVTKLNMVCRESFVSIASLCHWYFSDSILTISRHHLSSWFSPWKQKLSLIKCWDNPIWDNYLSRWGTEKRYRGT